MNFKRVLYQMEQGGEWKIGYMIGEYDGQNKTLLDENLNYVEKIRAKDGKKFSVYDCKDDLKRQLNITITL